MLFDVILAGGSLCGGGGAEGGGARMAEAAPLSSGRRGVAALWRKSDIPSPDIASRTHRTHRSHRPEQT